MKVYNTSLLALLALTHMVQEPIVYGQNSTPIKQDKGVHQKAYLVNLNTASLKDLEYLPGIGRTLAIRIVERRKIKQFNHIDDLKYVEGIGEKKFNKLKTMIKVK
ncbi:MAG TPA: helix-hairpin-helix domain-containing protein [Oligoflexia bacterium]|nr:helix-hairpin-helix domain-containing protein [Oligoflexia bacterium]HMR24752.1 helix-hairpin-helix domain-containing protein [Oligoflexia bacterium]